MLEACLKNTHLTHDDMQNRVDLLRDAQNHLVLLCQRAETVTSSFTENNSSVKKPAMSKHPGSFETVETRSLNKMGIVDLQNQKLTEQNLVLDSISSIISKQKEIGKAISKELEMQNKLLDKVNDAALSTQQKIASTDQKIKKKTFISL